MMNGFGKRAVRKRANQINMLISNNLAELKNYF